MENENVPKQFKINQNILQMLSCIENANIKNQGKFTTVICLKVTPKTKFNFVKNRFCVKMPVFP